MVVELFQHLNNYSNLLLTIFILMDIPMYLDRISMKLPISYLMGSEVENSKI